MVIDPSHLAFARGISFTLIAAIIACAHFISRNRWRHGGFLPGTMNDRNNGTSNYVFPADGKHHDEIKEVTHEEYGYRGEHTSGSVTGVYQ